jgi:hypothetical protein
MSDGLYVFLDFLLSTFYLGEAPEPSEVELEDYESWRASREGSQTDQ